MILSDEKSPQLMSTVGQDKKTNKEKEKKKKSTTEIHE